MYGSLFFLYRKINQRPAGGYHHLHTLKNQPKSIQIRDPLAGFRVPFFTPPKKSASISHKHPIKNQFKSIKNQRPASWIPRSLFKTILTNYRKQKNLPKEVSQLYF